MANLWNDLISKLPNPHFLQTYEWGQVKAKYGWIPYYAVWTDDGKFHFSQTTDSLSLITGQCVAAALILKKQVLSQGFAARLSILYAPKGPLLDWKNENLRDRVLNDLQTVAKKQGAIFLKIDPDIVLGRGVPNNADDVPDNAGQAARSELMRRGWDYSSDQIQFQNTVLIDLSVPVDEMLARMKPKTRYNIRLAEKKGVGFRVGGVGDLSMLYKMYAETSVRDGFVIRDENYYMTVWQLFMQSTIHGQPSTLPLIAEVNNEPVAAIFLFMFAGRAYYVYGMSRNIHREKMPAYLLQWEAMKIAGANGCAAYDLWGAPDVFDESDSMWGVYRFKEGLGGEVVRTLGAYDFAPNKLWYKLYAEIMPRVLDVMRSRGKEKTKQGLG
ncbi:peptidoglycan bridge formation glycyltransferase FemA/FemB family protein [Candidatus Villigracilis saccharophilus]|uniref:lipid II:glycine glycyltransferase FemX n=1 Tax=Candidatus Villigracilis saccharophilus TaxID=3140684 RepID=UPI0031374A7B|nr:peptidoglycan bridge formation glycyltransferase FemA/FemB family protein [Anaerolineales bacterium]